MDKKLPSKKKAPSPKYTSGENKTSGGMFFSQIKQSLTCLALNDQRCRRTLILVLSIVMAASRSGVELLQRITKNLRIILHNLKVNPGPNLMFQQDNDPANASRQDDEYIKCSITSPLTVL